MSHLPVDCLTKLSVKPGDVVVATLPEDVGLDEVFRVKRSFDKVLPRDVHLVVVSGKVKLEVNPVRDDGEGLLQFGT